MTKIIFVQGVLPRDDVIKLKKKTKETNIERAISHAIYHYLKCDG